MKKKQQIKIIVNPMKRCQRKELLSLYASNNNIVNPIFTNKIIVGESLVKSSNKKNKEDQTNTKYQWITYLKTKYDTVDSAYSSQNIIIMTGFDVLFYRQTWSQLVKSKLQSKLKSYVVTVIPRCNEGQIYYSQCLQHSPHFSLSQEGTSVLLKALEKKGNIRIVNYRKDPTKKKKQLMFKPKSWFSPLQKFKRNANVLSTVNNLFCDIGNDGLWEYFYKVSYVCTINED